MFRKHLIFFALIVIIVRIANTNGSRQKSANDTVGPAATDSSAFQSYLRATSILYGLTEVEALTSRQDLDLVTPTCRQQLAQIRKAILQKQPWAMKVHDASATKPSGFMFQHNFWLGRRDVCGAAQQPFRVSMSELSIKRTMKPGLIDAVAPFEVAYRVIYVKHNSSWQLQLSYKTDPILHLGLCLPAACGTNELKHLMQELAQRKSFFEANLYEFQTEVLYVKDLKLSDSFFTRFSLKIVTALVLFTIVMIFCARCFRRGSPPAPPSPQPQKNLISNMSDFVQCFDLNKNYRALFVRKEPINREIPVINGIRSIFATVIVIGHVIWFIRHTVSTLPFLHAILEDLPIPVQSFPLYGVDVFFTISGFLHVYHFLRNTALVETIRRNTLMQNVKLFFVHLFHRYLRLTPLFVVTMCLTDLCSAYANDVSLFHIYERYDLVCPKYWWRHLLFIHTYFPYEDLCMNWSWSLCCEMQYFIWATILLFIGAKQPKLVVFSVVALFCGALSWTIFIGTSLKFQFSADALLLTLDSLYIHPWSRMTPYIVGGGVAAIWYTKTAGRCQWSINWHWLERILWNLALLLIMGSAYTMFWTDLNYFTSMVLYSTGRLMIALATCWIIIGSAMGSGCGWSRLLEASVFQHLGRLTYTIYMVNALVVMFFIRFRESYEHADILTLILYSGSFLILTYWISIIFALAFELPYRNVSTLLMKNAEQQQRNSKVHLK